MWGGGRKLWAAESGLLLERKAGLLQTGRSLCRALLNLMTEFLTKSKASLEGLEASERVDIFPSGA